MKASILNKLTTLVERHQELEALLADPAVIADQKQFRELSREYAQLTPVVETFQAYRDTQAEIAAAEDMCRDKDPEVRELAQEELEAAISA